ncbi:hypothetical protein F9C07_93 [Aspergillus flavus]|uniref:Uncharacterized protein n=1 Tax=Aspergillus flavus (strain ATCC 200026 / FGSC A1120 / IAM 13836 / NRRL 3357 / JCM 12722 / SRRC 167) TaxID=332952 RepID=A0A7U2MNR3_ASPFN|nr:hypothetical protein F9C07_93 [Aspergillus flavus]
MPLRSHAPEGNTRPAGAGIVSACWPCNGAMIKESQAAKTAKRAAAIAKIDFFPPHQSAVIFQLRSRNFPT